MYTSKVAHEGLSSVPKKLPMDFVYSEDSGTIFHDICKHPNYYIYRNDLALLRERAAAVSKEAGKIETLVEIGSGLCHKSVPFIEAMEDLKTYIPIDIDGEVLKTAEAELKQQFPDLNIVPTVADMFAEFPLPPGPKIGLLVGSMPTAYDDAEVAKLIQHCLESLGDESVLLVTFDTNQNPETAMPCYRTEPYSQLAINVLRTLNTFGADCNLDAFESHVEWKAEKSKAEHSVMAKSRQVVTMDGKEYVFEEGEKLLVAQMYKRSLEEMEKIAQAAGAHVKHAYYDQDHYMCLVWIEKGSA